jgi:hypothetical protein
MLHFTIRALSTLLIALIFWSPGFAWGRSESHNYRELQRMRQQWKREAKKLDRLRRGRTYQYFQFDVFEPLWRGFFGRG